MRALRIGAAAIAALATAALAADPPVGTLDARCREAVGEGFAGVVLVERDGEILFHGAYGASAGDDTAPVTTGSRFYIGSIAKVITTTAALRLEARGDVSLDEPISAYLDGVPKDKRPITLRHLLMHTSGLPANHPDPAGKIGRDEFVDWCLGAELGFEPGEGWAYSNVGYSLAAAVLERAAGVPFTTLVRELVFEPAGMDGARFVGELDDNDTTLAIGSGPMATELGLDGDPRSYAGTWLRLGPGGIVLRAEDLLAFDRALRSRVLLTDDQIADTTTPVREGWGMGWRLSRTRRGDPLLFHDGDFPGFNAGYARVPSDNSCLVILCNREGAVRLVQREAMDVLMTGD